MNYSSLLFSGFIATLSLTTLMTASVGLGLSRMSMPFILGTMFTADRNKAAVVGFLVHTLLGWGFACLYALVFEQTARAGWWLGALLGLGHTLVILVVVLPLLPGIHPRMASENQGPEPTRALEPPGFLALYYGRRTPIVALLGHLIYGALFGGLYHPTGP